MIFFSQKQFSVNKNSKITCWHVLADDVDEYERLVDVLRGLDKGLWTGKWPTPRDPWAYNDRKNQIIKARYDLVQHLIDTEGAFEVPDDYFQFMVTLLRREMWRMYTDHDRREIDGKAERHFQEKLSWLATKIGRGERVEPHLFRPVVPCGSEDMIGGLKLIRDAIDNFDRRHRLRLNQDEDDDSPDATSRYLRMDTMERREYLERNAWLIPVLVGRKLQAEIPPGVGGF